MKKYDIHTDGFITYAGTDKIPKIIFYDNKNVGTLRYVNLETDNGEHIIRRIDELIAEEYLNSTIVRAVTKCSDGKYRYFIKHKDGNTTNDDVNNLIIQPFIERWVLLTYPGVVKNKYVISNIGTIRCLTDISYTQLKPYLNTGYMRTELKSNNEAGRISLYIHNLVAHDWINRLFPAEGYVVNHIDGNKTNNRFDNLEIVTQEENVHHAWLFGLNTPNIGTKNGCAKFTEADVEKICRLLILYDGEVKPVMEYFKNKNMSALYESIHRIKTQTNWAHISKKYFLYNGSFLPLIEKEDIEI